MSVLRGFLKNAAASHVGGALEWRPGQTALAKFDVTSTIDTCQAESSRTAEDSFDCRLVETAAVNQCHSV